MSRLALYFLGPFRAVLHERTVTGFRSDKARALLMYLAMEADRPHAREALAEMLWPDYPNPAGLTYLRATLLNLRTLLGDHAVVGDGAAAAASAPPFLLSTRETIQLNPAADVWVDATALGRLIAEPSALDDLEQAVSLCRGTFLEGFTTLASSVFDEWLLLTREQVNRQALVAMQRLALIYLEQGQFVQADDIAFRQLALDAWDETASRQRMAALALQGKRNAALAQYEQCRMLLAEAVGVEPSSDTVALRDAISAGTFQETWARTRASRQSTPAHSAPVPRTPYASPPVVARTRELEQLQQHLDQSLRGSGGVVFVVGSAGSGKSTLLHEFARRAFAQHTEIGVVAGRCSDNTGRGDPYLPFRTMLEMLTGDVQSGRPGGIVSEAHAEQLWKKAPLAAQILTETAPGLVGLLVPAEPLLLRVEAMTVRGDGTGAAWRARLAQQVGSTGAAALVTGDLYAQVTEYLVTLARRVPLLLLIDDLQWADTGSIGLLFHLGRQLADSHILVVGAFRPEEVALGIEGGRAPLITVVHELQRTYGELGIDLDQADGRRFIDELLDSEPNRLEASFRATLCAHTEGHPLFTIELLHRLLEQNVLAQGQDGACVQVLPARWESLPPRVVAVIAERIGRLPNEWSQLLRAASVEGDVFSAEVLVDACVRDEAHVLWALGEPLRRQYRLVQTDAQLRVGPQMQRLSRYRFVHSLYRQYLYNSMDAAQQSHLHEKVACALERLYGSAADDVAVQLAWHYEQAGIADKAIHFHSVAGDQAMRLSACEQAIAHYQSALALLGKLPASPAHTEQELALHVALATPLNYMRGWGSPAAVGAAARALELGRSAGGRAQLVESLLLLAAAQVGRGNPAQALVLGRELQRLAQETGDPVPMAAAHFTQGNAHFFGAEPALARPHLEQALALFDGNVHVPQILATDLKVTCLSLLAWVLWCLGFPDKSNQASEAALARACALDDPVTLGFALGIAGVMLDGARGDIRAAQAHAEMLGELAAHNDLNLYLTIAAIYQGVGRVAQGDDEAGLAQIQQGLDSWDATGTAAGRVVFTLALVRALRVSGRLEQALHVVETALTAVEAGGLRLVEAELWRDKGELLVARGTDSTAAEACFQRALTLAREQQARTWELHAAVSLCRMWQAQGKPEPAYALLAPLYGWFTEGFDTPDLQEARVLLDDLAQNRVRPHPLGGSVAPGCAGATRVLLEVP